MAAVVQVVPVLLLEWWCPLPVQLWLPS